MTPHSRPLAVRIGVPIAGVLAAVAASSLSAQQCGAGTTTFEWNTIHVAVAATDTFGVALHAFTSGVLYHGTPHRFSGYFDPDSAANWVASATRVAEARGRADSGVDLLQTPALVSTDSSYVLARRMAKHGKWTGDVTIVMVTPHDSDGFRLIAPATDADSLFRALFGRAVQSRLASGGGGGGGGGGPRIVSIRELDSPPTMIHAGRVAYPETPDGRVRDGEVVVQFVVGADGRPDLTTFCTIATDGPEFTTAARDAVRDTRFTPGMLHGSPVRTLVMQNVEFKWH